eukprot:12929705-Alexandrium_andersonii.AAC.1
MCIRDRSSSEAGGLPASEGAAHDGWGGRSLSSKSESVSIGKASPSESRSCTEIVARPGGPGPLQ